MLTSEDLKQIEDITKKATWKNWIFYILFFFVALLASFLSQYINTKGHGLATKQDIGAITDTIESIKSNISTNQDIEKQKREVKFNALLKSLKLIDAYISNHWLSSKVTLIDKQYASTEEYRDCQNQLILTCNNPRIIRLWDSILYTKDNIIGDELRLLSSYRQLVRQELSFGSQNLNLDTDKVWMIHSISKK